MKNNLILWSAKIEHALPSRVKNVLRPVYKIMLKAVIRNPDQSAPGELVQATIQGGELRGAHLTLNLKRDKQYWLGISDPQLQNAIADFIRPGYVVYDIGANIGFFSILLGKKVGLTGKVFCFEPSPNLIDRLAANLELNACTSQFVVVPEAVSDKTGREEFLISHSHPQRQTLAGLDVPEVEYQGKTTIQTVSLDDFVFEQENPAPDAIKMDIEGAESIAIHGMRRVLAEAAPILLVEIHTQTAADTVLSILRSLAYTIHTIEPGYPPVSDDLAIEEKIHILGLPPDKQDLL